MKITGIHSEKQGKTQERVVISTTDGNIECIFHNAGDTRGVIWLCGALGGFDGPSFGIFKILSERLVADGINSLRLHYRYPGDFEECVQDVLTGVDYLKQNRIDKVALVGHSFGGAVAIQAGTMSREVKAVVGLASQTYGAQRVAELAPRPLLLIHGERDRNLSVNCSKYIYQWAEEPKELSILKNNGHFLREAHQELLTWIRDWLINKLGKRE
ncbi:MAG: alpha/beta hydrolase [Dehalococcoidales bacterium]|nr:alpha/beta hydrolase [Dehalococcoidales bacterium]